MANTTKNRKDLKSYFVKNSIPTQSNFEDLIDGMLNQQDDGIIKVPGDPLKVTSDDSQGLQKIINFYERPGATNPAWSLQLNPRADGSDPQKAKPGFCVAVGQSSLPRLFIDKASGNIGIGTLDPIAPLDIAQAPRQAEDLPNHPKTIKGLYITGDFGADSDGIEFRRTNGTQGIGFGYNTIYAAGSNPDQVLQLKPKGASALRLLGKTNISDGSNLDPIESRMANGSLTLGSITSSYGGDFNVSAVWTSMNTAGLILQTNNHTEIAVHHASSRLVSLLYYDGNNNIQIGRDMGWGNTPVTFDGSVTFAGDVTLRNPIISNNTAAIYSPSKIWQLRLQDDGNLIIMTPDNTRWFNLYLFLRTLTNPGGMQNYPYR